MKKANNPNVPSQVVKDVNFPNYNSTLGIIPTSYKDSMDFYEVLSWLCKYLEDTVIPTVNQNGEATLELQKLYVDLKAYVDTFGDEIESKQPMITEENPLPSDLVSTVNQINKFVNQTQINLINTIPNKEDISNKVTEITSDSTDIEYPSAEAVYEYGLLKENVSNKVNEIDNESTNVEYPSAKAVYDVTQALNNLIKDIYNVLPRVSGTGSTITLNDTAETKLDITPKGNCEQYSYSGKNKFELPNSETKNGITYIKNSDGTFNISGTATNTTNFIIFQDKVLPNGYYTLSKNNDSTDISIKVQDYNESTYLADILTIGSVNYPSERTLNVAMSGNRILFRITVANGATISLQNVEVQLESGTAKTSFEKYVGGIPSPNPDYPQDIRVVTGDNDVVVQNRNLFDESQLLNAEGWTFENGYYNGRVDKYYFAFRYGFTFVNQFKENTQYSLKLKAYTTGGNPRFRFEYKDGTAYHLNFTETSPTEYTYTTTSGKTLSKIIGEFGTGGNETLYLSNIMLNEGSTATEYVPHAEQKVTLHLGSNYLAGIGDYKDTIVGKKDDWKIVRNVGKVVLTGQETFEETSSTTSRVYFGVQINNIYNYKQAELIPNILATKFMPQKQQGNFEPNHITMFTNNNHVVFIFEANTTESEARSILENMPLYYALATPTEETITDTTLINDLNNMYNLLGYDGQTNISIIPSSGNAQGELYVSTLKKIS